MGYRPNAVGNVTQRVSFKAVDLFSLDSNDKATFNRLINNKNFNHEKKQSLLRINFIFLKSKS